MRHPEEKLLERLTLEEALEKCVGTSNLRFILKSPACAYCGIKVTQVCKFQVSNKPPHYRAFDASRLVVFTIDHIKPLSLGGSNARDNMQTTCDLCNFRKGRKACVVGPATPIPSPDLVELEDNYYDSELLTEYLRSHIIYGFPNAPWKRVVLNNPHECACCGVKAKHINYSTFILYTEKGVKLIPYHNSRPAPAVLGKWDSIGPEAVHFLCKECEEVKCSMSFNDVLV